MRRAASVAPLQHRAAAAPPLVHEALRSPGQPLAWNARAFMESRFTRAFSSNLAHAGPRNACLGPLELERPGNNHEKQAQGMAQQVMSLAEPVAPSLRIPAGYDFTQVRVHTGSLATRSAQELNALAYTAGADIVFGDGQYAPETAKGRNLLAHELAHVVQQSGGEARVQRYEAGEHAEFGKTGDALRNLIAQRMTSYKVKKGESLRRIAKKFGVTVEDLKKANPGKLKRWKADDGTGRAIQGFNAGEEILIPTVLNEPTREAIQGDELSFKVGKTKVQYGEGIAMGDLFDDPGQMLGASEQDMVQVTSLIQKEKAGGTTSTEEWEKATQGRFLRLAQQNEAHFAPSDPRLVGPSGMSGADHKSQWEKLHKGALEKSQAGEVTNALRANSFADHFLTDAFAAGHLINKRDVMENFKARLPQSKGEFTADALTFFDGVAQQAFTGDVQKAFSEYETVEFKGLVFRPNIDSASRLSQLLQGIQKGAPDLLANAVAKGAHDRLNTAPGGIAVENARGDKWNLSGDTTLNEKSKEIGRRAVAQSQLNVLDAFKQAGPFNFPALFKKVWDYVPRPTAAGAKVAREKVSTGTDPKDQGLRDAVVSLIRTNYRLIIENLVQRGTLKKA